MGNKSETIARQKALNEERNPRITIMNEATNTTNPITGKPYENPITQIYSTRHYLKNFPDITNKFIKIERYVDGIQI